jgi:hypothetical protein
MDPAIRCRWKPAFAVYSPPAMCGPDRSSGWAPQSARARSLRRNYTLFSQIALRHRQATQKVKQEEA